MTTGEKLKAWRKKHGLTQAQASEEIGLKLKTLQHIEQGREYHAERLLLLALIGAGYAIKAPDDLTLQNYLKDLIPCGQL